MAEQMQLAGLPPFEPEVKFAKVLKRGWAIDFGWPEIKLGLEVDGGIWSGGRHVRGKGYEDDCVKLNEALILGWRVLRVTSDMVRDGRALRQVQRALGIEPPPLGRI